MKKHLSIAATEMSNSKQLHALSTSVLDMKMY